MNRRRELPRHLSALTTTAHSLRSLSSSSCHKKVRRSPVHISRHRSSLAMGCSTSPYVVNDKRRRRTSLVRVDDVEGLQLLQWEDQQKIRKYIDGAL